MFILGRGENASESWLRSQRFPKYAVSSERAKVCRQVIVQIWQSVEVLAATRFRLSFKTSISIGSKVSTEAGAIQAPSSVCPAWWRFGKDFRYSSALEWIHICVSIC